jgi:hypothetical protein
MSEDINFTARPFDEDIARNSKKTKGTAEKERGRTREAPNRKRKKQPRGKNEPEIKRGA